MKWALGAAALLLAGGAVGLVLLLAGNDDPETARGPLAQATVKLAGAIAVDIREVRGNSPRRELAARLARHRRSAERLSARAGRELGAGDRTRPRLVEANRALVRSCDRLQPVVGDAGATPSDRKTATPGAGELEPALAELERAGVLLDVAFEDLPEQDRDSLARARAALPKSTVELPLEANARIAAAGDGELAGASVAGAGDVNGDGRPDLVVGAPGAGKAYVVLDAADGDIPLGDLGGRGFAITGLPASEPDAQEETDFIEGLADVAVAGAGDLDGDGLADLVVGAQTASKNGREESGSAYVVYGSRAPGNVDVGSLSERGFRVDGPGAFWRLGQSVAAVGDVTGDGKDDLAVGAQQHVGSEDITAAQGRWVTYVLPGGPRRTGVARPLRRRGASPGVLRIVGAGSSVAAAGDVNGDGVGDLVAGEALNRMGAPGSAVVVFGTRGGTSTVDALRPGRRGFAIEGVAGRSIGSSVAGGGDLNADGLADVVVGSTAPDADSPEPRAHVVFGRKTTRPVALGRLGSGGVTVAGAGGRVASAGDVNGDGLRDVLLADAARPRRGAPPYPGGARVLLGRPGGLGGGQIDASGSPLEASPARGGPGVFAIDGLGVRAMLGELNLGGVGTALAAVGDRDGDGRDDLAIGAPTATAATAPPAEQRHGAVYVVRWVPPPAPRGPLTGPVTPDGVGKVRVGARIAQAERLLGTRYQQQLEGCGYIPTLDARISLLVGRGTVARVDVRGPGFPTESGVEVGDTESAVLAAYRGRIKRQRAVYDPGGSFLIHTPKGAGQKRRRTIFETDGRQVTAIRAGRLPEVALVEGCA